ncbi:putative odorant receptor 71a [Zophobas morio]|uniref:putative odorant receptor 71a n=1 Tax=Zophobas morio TaxID=2755281 RepID=UPI0030834BCB
MEKFDWKIIVRANLFILNLVGLWPKSGKGYSLNLYTLYALVVNTTVDAHNVFQAAYICAIYKDLQAIIAIIFILVTEADASIKIFYFVRRISLVQSLLKELENDEFQPRNSQQREMVQRTLNPWMLIYRTFWITTGTDLCFLFIFPIMDGSHKDYRLPFWAWYPFDTKRSPNYEVTYIYQVLCTWFLASCNIIMDTMFAALMTYIMAQCDILSDDLRNLADGDDSYNVKIVKCVQHHKKILRYEIALRKSLW